TDQTPRMTTTSSGTSAVAAGGLCHPDPLRFIALRQSRSDTDRNGTPRGIPSPVLAPGTALGSRLRVALSSGQVSSQLICGLTAEPLFVRAPTPDQSFHFFLPCGPPRG